MWRFQFKVVLMALPNITPKTTRITVKHNKFNNEILRYKMQTKARTAGRVHKNNTNRHLSRAVIRHTYI